MTQAPSDQELLELLSGDHGVGEVSGLSRRAYRYATSAPLEELRVKTADGELDLILKDLSRERLLGDAGEAKPEFLHRPEREIETYRRLLAPARIGPRFFGAVAEPDPGRCWLLIEKVPGVELWQIGDLPVWEEVARWLGAFHAAFAGRLDEARAANPHLLDFSAEWFRSWCARAMERIEESDDGRAPALRNALGGYEAVVNKLAALPRTLVHGELYPSNVLVVTSRPQRTCPVDWEMAAIGPGLGDLAALVGGWGEAERRSLVSAYARGLHAQSGPEQALDDLEADLARCRLHLALQWLGWSAAWRPPSEHAHDWLGEALGIADQLGLGRGP
jgi:aminoglycoside phosphotransferase (APT) family kinase protein